MNPQDVRGRWAARTGEFSPTYYAHYGPDERSEAVGNLFERALDPTDAILEVGCSSGRHLAHLADQGFANLTGIELNDEAFDVMAETYPELADLGTFHHGVIEDFVRDFDDNQFDAVYSVETLQHLHPDAAWVFSELCRITDRLLVTVEIESDEGEDVTYVDDGVPLYHRDWSQEFTDCGLAETVTRPVGRDTLRAFQPHDGETADR